MPGFCRALCQFYRIYLVTFQLYDRRKKSLKRKEEEKWGQIDCNYMTEESGDEDGDVIRQHKLVWHSEGNACGYNCDCPVS